MAQGTSGPATLDDEKRLVRFWMISLVLSIVILCLLFGSILAPWHVTKTYDKEAEAGTLTETWREEQRGPSGVTWNEKVTTEPPSGKKTTEQKEGTMTWLEAGQPDEAALYFLILINIILTGIVAIMGTIFIGLSAKFLRMAHVSLVWSVITFLSLTSLVSMFAIFKGNDLMTSYSVGNDTTETYPYIGWFMVVTAMILQFVTIFFVVLTRRMAMPPGS